MKARIDGEEIEVTIMEKTENGEFKVIRHDTDELLTVTNDQLIEEPQTPARDPFKSYEEPTVPPTTAAREPFKSYDEPTPTMAPTSARRDPFKNYEPEENDTDVAVLGAFALILVIAIVNK